MSNTELTDKHLDLLKEQAIRECEKEVKQRVYKYFAIIISLAAMGGLSVFALLIDKFVNDQIQPLASSLLEKRAKLEYFVEDSKKLIESIDDHESKIGKLYRNIKTSTKQYEQLVERLEVLSDQYNTQKKAREQSITDLKALNEKLSRELELLKAEPIKDSVEFDQEQNIRISIPIYGNVNAPIANTIQELLLSEGYAPWNPEYLEEGLNHIDKVFVLYNKFGCKKVLEIEKLLNSIEGLQTVVLYEVKGFTTTDIAITFQNIDTIFPEIQSNLQFDPCKPVQPE